MSIQVAVASTDGKVINEHFGRAKEFHIFAIENGSFRFVRSKQVNPVCNGGEHSQNDFDAVADALAGSKAIIVAKIGDGAANYMESRGFEIFEAPYPIELVLEKIISDRMLEE